MYSLLASSRKPVTSRPLAAVLDTAAAVTCMLLIALSPWAVAGGIYKSIDSQGNIVFTDQPTEGAEAVNTTTKQRRASAESGKSASSDEGGDGEEREDELDDKEPTGTVLVAPEPVNPPKPDVTETEEPTDLLAITRVEILTPEHNTTLLDPLGQIWVEVQSYPTPMSQSGLTAQLWMDERLVTSDKSTSLRLPLPAHGTHVLQVKLVDEKDQLFHESTAIDIHIKYKSAEQ